MRFFIASKRKPYLRTIKDGQYERRVGMKRQYVEVEQRLPKEELSLKEATELVQLAKQRTFSLETSESPSPSITEELAMEEAHYVVIYYIVRDSSSVFVATCWGHCFDGVEKLLSDEHAREAVESAWPTLLKLLDNGNHGEFAHGALIQLKDPDEKDMKWFLVFAVENLHLNGKTEVLGKKTRKATAQVMEQSLEVVKELAEPAHEEKHWALVEELTEHMPNLRSIPWGDILVTTKSTSKKVFKWSEPYLATIAGTVAAALAQRLAEGFRSRSSTSG